MDEKIYRVRNMLANNAMAAFSADVRKLIDRFGVVGAENYLEVQLHMLRKMRDEDEQEEGVI